MSVIDTTLIDLILYEPFKFTLAQLGPPIGVMREEASSVKAYGDEKSPAAELYADSLPCAKFKSGEREEILSTVHVW